MNIENALIQAQVDLSGKRMSTTDFVLSMVRRNFITKNNILSEDNRLIAKSPIRFYKDDYVIKVYYNIAYESETEQIIDILDVKAGLEDEENPYYILIKESYIDLELEMATVILITKDFDEVKNIVKMDAVEEIIKPEEDEFITFAISSQPPKYERYVIHTYQEEL